MAPGIPVQAPAHCTLCILPQYGDCVLCARLCASKSASSSSAEMCSGRRVTVCTIAGVQVSTPPSSPGCHSPCEAVSGAECAGRVLDVQLCCSHHSETVCAHMSAPCAGTDLPAPRRQSLRRCAGQPGPSPGRALRQPGAGAQRAGSTGPPGGRPALHAGSTAGWTAGRSAPSASAPARAVRHRLLTTTVYKRVASWHVRALRPEYLHTRLSGNGAAGSTQP